MKVILIILILFIAQFTFCQVENNEIKTDSIQNLKANKAMKHFVGTWYLKQYQGNSVLHKKKPKAWAKKYEIDTNYNIAVSYIKLENGYCKIYRAEADGQLKHYNEQIYLDFNHITYVIDKNNVSKTDKIPISAFHKNYNLIGNWKATNQTKSSSYLIDFLTLNISKDYKLTFKQLMCEEPYSYVFEGLIMKDIIFYKTKSYSHFGGKEEFLGAKTIAFQINSMQPNNISITNLENNETIEYIKQ